MDYDLTTDGEINDLTLQIEFLKKGDGLKNHGTFPEPIFLKPFLQNQ